MPVTRPKKGDLVLLRWVDITDDNDWQQSDDPDPDLTTCKSVGWVARWTSVHVVLVRTFGGTGKDRRAGDRMTFPRGCVIGFDILSKAPH